MSDVTQWRRLARDWTPPGLVRWFNELRVGVKPIRYVGDYGNWDHARADSDGYDTDFIFEAVCRAARRVRDGSAAFERDAVAFDRIEYNYAILATLLRIACLRGNNLHVLDFGGSLGLRISNAGNFSTAWPI